MSVSHQIINIDTHQNTDLSRFFYKWAYLEIPGSPEIPNQCIEKMNVSMLENAFNFLKKGVFVFVGEEFSRHAGI
jgi:hypothetical protein